jgi:6-phosphogluconate dehydrogenase
MMQLGMIGLGRMGANIVRRLMRDGHSCSVYDRDPAPGKALAAEGATAVGSLADLVASLEAPRAIWIMLPAGAPTEQTIDALTPLLAAGDVIIDGGNTFWQDDVRRGAALAQKGLHYLDVGTSGGVWGLERGYCMMIGGEPEAFARLDPIFATLAPGLGTIERTPGREAKGGTAERGYIHCGPNGAGHFVKMIHNGIEYGLMQAYAEGFDILHGVATADVPRERRYKLDLADVAEVWRRGSVVGSWLLDLTAIALKESPDLQEFSGRVSDSGEGRWTAIAAIDEGVPAPVLTTALQSRFASRSLDDFANKALSAMRKQFGGHAERPGVGG